MSSPTRSARVLVVDDEEPIRRMIARILERAGHSCAEAGDAVAAQKLAAACDFDLVTCDINLPGASGLSLLRYLRGEHPDLAVLMITGKNDPKTADVATDLGAYGYIAKPFGTNEIMFAASNALRRRQLELDNRRYREHLEQLVSERTEALQDTVRRLTEAECALRESREEAIRRLANAAEFRDPTTGAHIARVAAISGGLAELAGLDPERVEMIRIASPMHDIGKICVPDDILTKRGKLTHAEMEEMRKHPLVGQQILANSDSELLQLGGLIALTHHERWDGRGYPHGLGGTEIPIEGRIVAIADVFDALTTERPYKPAYSLDQTFAIMREERGRHFDADLLDLFLANPYMFGRETPPAAVAS